MKVVNKVVGERINIDEDENGLYIELIDSDGVHISEMDGKGKVYVYYSELDKLLQKLKKIKYDWDHNSRSVKQTPGSPKNITQYANRLYNDCGKLDGFKDYKKYIESSEWKGKRDARIKKDNGRCRNCGSKLNIEVHHKNYLNLGNESINDLVTLCSDCHKNKTLLNRKKRKGIVTEFS